jgi:hypothetical protein
MALVENNFGSNVLGSSTNGEGSALSQELGKTEVSKLKISVVSDEKILRL